MKVGQYNIFGHEEIERQYKVKMGKGRADIPQNIIDLASLCLSASLTMRGTDPRICVQWATVDLDMSYHKLHNQHFLATLDNCQGQIGLLRLVASGCLE